MLESIFGSKTVEKILFYLLKNEKAYGFQLSKTFQESLSPFQKGLDRLETGGIIVSFQEGKTVVYRFNPRYPFLKELMLFLEKAYRFLPQEFKERYYEQKLRKRPRRKGKPL
ncbi:MAG: winged helix-turn-helix transcriptional regulator [Chlamydiia bacterium]|nr:winged helix-turn-helix transcriptional regulator [Chlamydiia bacterium]MCB1115348.1 winged helix-turn-helix transcriptional regulator [Chlamydiia bacterium]